MTEAAMWREYKRKVQATQPGDLKMKATADRSVNSLKASGYRSFDRYQPLEEEDEGEDPDCMSIDMIEEAKHRVYFGFFDLNLLESGRGVKRNARAAETFKTRTEVGNSQKRHERVDTSPYDGNAWYHKARAQDKSADRSINTAGSGIYYRKHRDFTTHTEFSHATDFPHTCSLYREAKLSDSYRDTSSSLA
jgi:hypothetical protein